jgi:hypothetical protein
MPLPTSPRRRLVGLIAAVCVATSAVPAQAMPVQDGEKVSPLFRSEAPLAMTFTANVGQLRDDKKHGDKAPWRGAMLTYKGTDSALVRVPARAKVHGIWRLKNCEFPPIRLNFAGKDTKNTVFDQVDKPKLTNYCRDTDAYEQYVLQELQLYRIYQVLTPTSHRVRLLRLTYADSGSGKTEAVRYGFLIEDPDQMAARLGGKLTKLKGAGIGDFDETTQAVVYLFQYLIGNTDFSFNQLHNGEIIALPDGRNLPVAYDFDFAGAVNTRYATPDPQVKIRRVRDRKFRGYCQLNPEFVKAIPIFQQKKDAIYALYTDEVGRLMDPVVVRETLDYFNEFYDAIGDQGKADRVIFRDCLGPR